jgi:phosphatidylglycerophosphatase A
MMKLAKAAATVLGIGYINKGAGTVVSVLYCIAWCLLPDFTDTKQILILTVVLTAGVWSGTIVEKEWGKDSNRVVIDELAGMMIALLFIPVKIKYAVAALVLFRFFDILKPLGIKKMETFKAGWGVMADDVLSGVYALIILKVVTGLNLF